MNSVYQKRKIALHSVPYSQKELDAVENVPVEVLEPAEYQGGDCGKATMTMIEVSITIPADLRIKKVDVSVELEG